jgi:hypothetical protein
VSDEHKTTNVFLLTHPHSQLTKALVKIRRAKLGISDVQRTGFAVQGAKGKRLMYRDSLNG